MSTRIPALPLTSRVALDKLLNLSEAGFPHLSCDRVSVRIN